MCSDMKNHFCFCPLVWCICEDILALKGAQGIVGMYWGLPTVSSANGVNPAWPQWVCNVKFTVKCVEL